MVLSWYFAKNSCWKAARWFFATPFSNTSEGDHYCHTRIYRETMLADGYCNCGVSDGLKTAHRRGYSVSGATIDDDDGHHHHHRHCHQQQKQQQQRRQYLTRYEAVRNSVYSVQCLEVPLRLFLTAAAEADKRGARRLGGGWQRPIEAERERGSAELGATGTLLLL